MAQSFTPMAKLLTKSCKILESENKLNTGEEFLYKAVITC